MKIQLSLFAAAMMAASCAPKADQPAPPPAPQAAEMAPAATPVVAQDIVDTAIANGQFRTLVAAVQAADLEATLRSTGPFTVFAPNDAAFAALPAGTVENLLKPENKAKLVAILTYHVVPGRVMAADVAGKTVNAMSVEGATVKVVGAANGVVTINGARVIAADVQASNGVIHVIDKVIMPPK